VGVARGAGHGGQPAARGAFGDRSCCTLASWRFPLSTKVAVAPWLSMSHTAIVAAALVIDMPAARPGTATVPVFSTSWDMTLRAV